MNGNAGGANALVLFAPGLRWGTMVDHRATGFFACLLANAGDFVREAASLLTQRCETVGVFLRQRLR